MHKQIIHKALKDLRRRLRKKRCSIPRSRLFESLYGTRWYVERLESRQLLDGGGLDPTPGWASDALSAPIGQAIVVQGDGHTLKAGSFNGDAAVFRYKPDGTLDKSFSDDGVATIDFGSTLDVAHSLVVQPCGGKILIAGSSGSDLAIARLNFDGSLDLSFGVDGTQTSGVHSGTDFGDGIYLSAKGEFFLAGFGLLQSVSPSGKAGDVITIDLKLLFQDELGLSFTALQLLNNSSGKIVLPESLSDQPFSGSGKFYFAPSAGYTGTSDFSVMIDGNSKTIHLSVMPGFSTAGPQAVTFGSMSLDILRVQQRLRFFGYVGADGQAPILNGTLDENTRWAIGLFNSAMTGLPHNPSATAIRRDFINALDTPHWIEFVPSTINSTPNDGFYIHSNLDGTEQSERWASDFAQQFVDSESIRSLPDNGQPAGVGSIAQQERVELRRASRQQGGELGEPNGAHHGGLNLDIETPATNTPTTPFFAVETVDSIRYVSGPSQNSFVFHMGNSVYEAGPLLVNPQLGHTIANAVRVEIPSQPQSPLSAWNNYSVLRGIQTLIRNPEPTVELYDVQRVRQQIKQALAARAVPNGPLRVANIYYNDPRTWPTSSIAVDDLDPTNEQHWLGDGGQTSRVQFSLGANGIFQVNLLPPVRPDSFSTNPPAENPELADSATKILDGLEEFRNRLSELTNTAEFAASLPFVNQTLGDLLPVEEALQTGLIDRLDNYFNDKTTVLTDDVVNQVLRQVNVVAGLLTIKIDPASVTGGRYLHADREELRFNFTLEATKTIQDQPFSLGTAATAEGLVLPNVVDVDVTSKISIDMSFGIDLRADSPFFVRLNELRAHADVHESNLNFDINVGFLGAQVKTGHVDLKVELSAVFNSSLQDALGTVFADDLEQGGDPAQMFTTQVVNKAASAFLPVTASLGGFSTNGSAPSIALLSDNAFSGVTPAVALGDFDQLKPFRNVTPVEVLTMLTNVRDWLGQLDTQLPSDVSVPFAKDLTTNQLFHLDSAFTQAVVDPSTAVNGTPKFRTAQELVSTLGAQIDFYSYDAASEELTFDFDFLQTFNTFQRTLDLSPDVTLSLPNLELPLHSVTTNSSALVSPGAAFDFTFGVDLAKTPGTLDDHDYFLDNTHVAGTVGVSSTNINFTGNYGFLGVTSSGGTGSSDMAVNIQGLESRRNLGDPLPQTTIDVSGVASFEFPNFLPQDNAFSVAPPQIATFTWSDLGDLGTRDLHVPSEYICHQYMAYDQFVDALQVASNYVTSIAGHASITTGLPVIDKSLTEFQTFATNFQSVVTQLRNAPQTTVQAWQSKLESTLEQSLGLPAGSTTVTLGFSCNEVSIRLQLTQQLINRNDPLNMSVHGFGLVGGTIHTEAQLSVDLKLGIDIAQPSNPRPYLDDASKVEVALQVEGANINAKASLGPLGIFIVNGQVAVDEDGLAAGGTTAPAKYIFDVKDKPNHKYYVGDTFGLNQIESSTVGKAEVRLPLYFPTISTPLGGSAVDGPDADSEPDNQVVFSLTNLGNPSSATLVAPDINALIDEDKLLDSIVDGLNVLFDDIANQFKTKLLSQNLPLVGKGLAQSITFVQDIKQKVIVEINKAQVKTAGIVQSALFNALSASGLDILSDGPDAGTGVGLSDIQVTTGSNGAVEFNMKLVFNQGSRAPKILPLQSDLGLPNLGFKFESEGTVKISLDYTWQFGFGVNKQLGFYLKDRPGADIVAVINATIPGTGISATVGFLKFEAKDDSTEPSHLQAELSLSLRDANSDGKVTLAEMASGNFITPRLNGEAAANFLLTAEMGDDANFPSIEADLRVNWGFSNANPSAGDLGQLDVKFRDVRLNGGEFISSFLGPIFDRIDQVIEPVRPVIEFLAEPLPVINDISALQELLINLGFPHAEDDSIRVVDLISFLAKDNSASKLVDTLDSLLTAISFINSVSGAQSISLGGFSLDDPRGLGFDLGTATPRIYNQADTSHPAFQLSRNLKSTLNSKDRGFSVPILDDPMTAFRLLLGQPVDLLSYDLPLLNGDIKFPSYRFPIFPPFISGKLGGEFNFNLDLGFGYDTQGFQLYKDSNHADTSIIGEGFYITDRPGDEIMLGGELSVSGYGGGSFDLGPITVGAKSEALVVLEWMLVLTLQTPTQIKNSD